MSFQYVASNYQVLADCPTLGACQVARRLLEMDCASNDPKGRIVEIGVCSQCHNETEVNMHNFRGMTLNCCDECVSH